MVPESGLRLMKNSIESKKQRGIIKKVIEPPDKILFYIAPRNTDGYCGMRPHCALRLVLFSPRDLTATAMYTVAHSAHTDTGHTDIP